MHHIYLVRHGITEGMEAGLAQGITDSPLSALGRKQAQAAANVLKSIHFDAALSSPLGRTMETARIICSVTKNELEIVPSLREMDFGWLEGSAYFDKPKANTPFWMYPWLIGRILIAQLTGDSLLSMKRRALKNWEEIRSRCAQGTILVVSHSIIMNYMLRAILPKEKGDENYHHLKPCSISDLIFHDDGRIKVGRLNRDEHLKNLE